MSSQPYSLWHIKLTYPNSPGTSHIVAVDHTGLAISEITTINLLFGSRVMVPETGIIMNNEMDGESSLQTSTPCADNLTLSCD